MKKSFSLFKGGAFSKFGFLPFVMTFLLFAAMQVDGNAQSYKINNQQPPTQPTYKSVYSTPAGPWVSVPVAKERLLSAMQNLKHIMEQNAEGSGPYNAALLRVTYFLAIYQNLEAGKSVPDSIVAGLEAINNDLTNGVTPEEAQAEKNAAITLLRP